jgi:SAM-dependent methyltransferase
MDSTAVTGAPHPPTPAGYLDECDQSGVSGWAYDGGAAAAATLDVHLDGSVVATLHADLFRADLELLGIGNGKGCHGFALRFSPEICAGLTSGTHTIGVTHRRTGVHLDNSPRRVVSDALRIAATSSLRDLCAHRYLSGNGIEIGALWCPQSLPPGAAARYVDLFPTDGLRSRYRELDSRDLAEVDVVDDGAILSTFADGSVDFVIANQFLEHTEDPLAVLATFARVLRPGGILMVSVPNQRYGPESTRPITTVEHVEHDRLDGGAASRTAHYAEWIEHVERVDPARQPELFAARLGSLRGAGEKIHFHCWSAEGFVATVVCAIERSGLGVHLVHFGADEAELVVICRRH